MNSVASQTKRFIRLTPNNNSVSFSPSNSQNCIRFTLSEVEALAFLKDSKLNFNVVCYKTPAIGLNPAVKPDYDDDFNIDQVLGFSCFIDQIVINSRKFGTQLEMINNLSRLQSSYYRSNASVKMMSSNNYNLFKGVGVGKYNKTSGGLITRSSENPQLRAMRKSIIRGVACSIPIHSGLFLQEAPLDLKKVGGLDITIYLSRNEQVLYGDDVDSNSYFELSNVSLSVPLLYKSGLQISQTPPELPLDFLTWTSVYSTVSSVISSTSNRLYLRGLVSTMINFLPTSHINNIAFNNMSLSSVGCRQLTFLKDGARFPLEKTLIVADKSTSTKNSSTVYPEIVVDYMSSWKLYKSLYYTQVISENMTGLSQDTGVFSIGCNYSPESSGINVAGILSTDLQILDDISYAMFNFYMNRSSFLLTDQGIRVL